MYMPSAHDSPTVPNPHSLPVSVSLFGPVLLPRKKLAVEARRLRDGSQPDGCAGKPPPGQLPSICVGYGYEGAEDAAPSKSKTIKIAAHAGFEIGLFDPAASFSAMIIFSASIIVEMLL